MSHRQNKHDTLLIQNSSRKLANYERVDELGVFFFLAADASSTKEARLDVHRVSVEIMEPESTIIAEAPIAMTFNQASAPL